jgi:hypothetical protein
VKYLLSALLCLFACITNAQDLKYEMSEPVDISTAGWDKVLLMPNGNTVLFHFEVRKGIIVKVFDKSRKEIASKKHICNVLDINRLELAGWIGAEAIGNEAVIFITQEVENRRTLVRLRINGNTAGLISEEKLVQSPSFQKEVFTKLLREKGSDNYYIVCNQTSAGYAQKEINVLAYDATHTRIKDIPLNIDAKGLDDMDLGSANIDDNGNIALAVEITRIIQHPDVLERVMFICILPKDGTSFQVSKVALPSHFRTFETSLAYNPFSKYYQLLTTFQLDGYKQFGFAIKQVEYNYNELYILNQGSPLTPIQLPNSKLNTYIQSTLDTSYIFNGRTRLVCMNDFGLSTVIYDGILMPKTTNGHFDAKGMKRIIGITQYDEQGREVNGLALSRAKLKAGKSPYLFASNNGITSKNTYALQEIRDRIENEPSNRMQGKASQAFIVKNPFINEPNNEGQICDISCMSANKLFYIFYNETYGNFNNTVADIPDSLYSSDFTHATYYKIGKKKELTKAYLFGQPIEGEYKQLLTQSSHFDEKAKIYATVVRHRKGKETQTKIAWVQL